MDERAGNKRKTKNAIEKDYLRYRCQPLFCLRVVICVFFVFQQKFEVGYLKKLFKFTQIYRFRVNHHSKADGLLLFY